MYAALCVYSVCMHKVMVNEMNWRMKFGNIAGRGVGSGRSCSLFNEFKLRSIKNNEIYIANT